jgi:hypothetical protein
VTPLRDGMNLVAKEYVAPQPADDPGILVLSYFADAARGLAEAAPVNPHDVEGMAGWHPAGPDDVARRTQRAVDGDDGDDQTR